MNVQVTQATVTTSHNHNHRVRCPLAPRQPSPPLPVPRSIYCAIHTHPITSTFHPLCHRARIGIHMSFNNKVDTCRRCNLRMGYILAISHPIRYKNTIQWLRRPREVNRDHCLGKVLPLTSSTRNQDDPTSPGHKQMKVPRGFQGLPS